jgi:hypothetical protein
MNEIELYIETMIEEATESMKGWSMNALVEAVGRDYGSHNKPEARAYIMKRSGYEEYI